MRAAKRKNKFNIVALALIAVILTSVSFVFASGEIIGDPAAMVSSVIATIYGRPYVYISRDASSPRSTLPMNSNQTLAVFDVRASNVTHVANVSSVKFKIAIGGSGASALNLYVTSAVYRYCIPAGITYGYGYPGGQCGEISMQPYGVSRNGNTYTAQFGNSLPVYPVQSSGTITLYGYGNYSSGSPTANQNGRLDTVAVSAVAAGDQCQTIQYGYQNRYSYILCKSGPASVYGASVSSVTFTRPYGYAYANTPSYGYKKPRVTNRIYW